MKNFTPLPLFIFLVLLGVPKLGISGDCYQSSVLKPTPFMGNNGEIFKLSDGSIWEVKNEYEYMYEYYPKVIVCPKLNKVVVGEKTLSVKNISMPPKNEDAQPQVATEPTKSVIESTIINDFDGLELGNIYKLANGQVWEQTEPWIWVWVWVNPSVIIWNEGGIYKMKVEQIDHAVVIKKVN